MKKTIPKILGSILMFTSFMGGLSVVRESTVEICTSPAFYFACTFFFGVGAGFFNLEVK